MIHNEKILLLLLITIYFFIGCGNFTTYTFDRTYRDPAFRNHSNQKPWSIQIQNEIVRAGKGAVRFELRPFDGWHDSNIYSSRAELRENFVARMNRDIWYGLSIYIPDEYPAMEGKSMVIGQWHQKDRWGYPILSQTYDVTNEELHVYLIPARFWTSPDGAKHYSQKRGLWKIKDFKQNVWHDLIYQVKWSGDDSGYFNLWHNGVQKIDHKGLTYIPGEIIGPFFKFGLYQMSGAASKSQTHVIYFDEYRRGKSYEEVDPAQNEKMNKTNQ